MMIGLRGGHYLNESRVLLAINRFNRYYYGLRILNSRLRYFGGLFTGLLLVSIGKD